MRRSRKIVLLGLVGLVLASATLWVIVFGPGWTGAYSDLDLDPGSRVSIAGMGTTAISPAGWTCRVVEYVPLPRWTGLGLGAQFGTRQAVYMFGPRRGQGVVMVSYFDDTHWQNLLSESQKDAESSRLDLTDTVFGSRSVHGTYGLTPEGMLLVAVYLRSEGQLGPMLMLFSTEFGDKEPSQADAIGLINDTVAAIQLEIRE